MEVYFFNLILNEKVEKKRSLIISLKWLCFTDTAHC